LYQNKQVLNVIQQIRQLAVKNKGLTACFLDYLFFDSFTSI